MWIMKKDNTGGTLTHIPTGTRIVIEGNYIARQDQNGKHLGYIVKALDSTTARATLDELCQKIEKQGLLFSPRHSNAQMPIYPKE